MRARIISLLTAAALAAGTFSAFPVCAASSLRAAKTTAAAKAASGVSSESVDGYSVSYRAYNTEAEKAAEKRVNVAIKRYLGSTGLMFRGCG